jgi:vacuolar iron transporter family protein
MAASNFSGTKADRDERGHLAAVERKHIALAPEGEREEIRQIFAAKEFDGEGGDSGRCKCSTR